MIALSKNYVFRKMREKFFTKSIAHNRVSIGIEKVFPKFIVCRFLSCLGIDYVSCVVVVIQILGVWSSFVALTQHQQPATFSSSSKMWVC